MNRGDIDAVLRSFTEDGVVDDWGRRFVGREAIRRWSDKEFIGAKGVLTVLKVSGKAPEVRISADWKSNYYSGTSTMVFVLDGQHISEMRILSA